MVLYGLTSENIEIQHQFTLTDSIYFESWRELVIYT